VRTVSADSKRWWRPAARLAYGSDPGGHEFHRHLAYQSRPARGCAMRGTIWRGPRPLVRIRTENPDNHICFVHALRRELPGLPVAEIYSDLAHHFHHNRV
jgi:hypothetical protein